MKTEKYIICCDFATLKCSRFEFATKLSEFTSHYENINNFVWLIEIDEIDFIPYNPDNICESIYKYLSDFLNYDSFLIVFKASEFFSSDNAHFTA